jgi:hypothetical protein
MPETRPLGAREIPDETVAAADLAADLSIEEAPNEVKLAVREDLFRDYRVRLESLRAQAALKRAVGDRAAADRLAQGAEQTVREMTLLRGEVVALRAARARSYGSGDGRIIAPVVGAEEGAP